MATTRKSQPVHTVRQGIHTQTSGSPPSQWAVSLAMLGVLTGFGVRLHRLGQESLWYDEIVSVDLAASAIRELLEQTARDIHPPGYYLVLHGWRAIAQPVMELGHSFEFLYAYPSLAAGIVLCALVWVLACRTTSPSVAALAVWLCALHPFQVTYSQEVRMYTLGAVLCMLYVLANLGLFFPLRATSPMQRRPTPWTLLIAIAIVTAAGLYTFYYFAFLIAVTIFCVGIGWLRAPRPSRRSFVQWLVAHLAALVLWLPWLPTFLAQAIDPPVPPWRVAWSGLGDTVQALLDLTGVYTAGHALEAPTLPMIPVVLAFVLLPLVGYANYFRARKRNDYRNPASADALRVGLPSSVPVLLAFALAPPVLLIALSATVTPLFHTRYVYVFHAPFLILIAAAIIQLWHMRRLLGWLAGALVVAICLWGTHWFWTNPTMRSDDHRAAVTLLASHWQPGEVILANAGWTYRVLRVYWPQRATQPSAAVPPPLSSPLRLEPDLTLPTPPSATVPLLYTGSVDSQDNLGWNQPGADFYALSSQDAVHALDQLRANTAGVWHYRLYDTVSDPAGLIRNWFDESARQTLDMPIPGRDYLRLGRYVFPQHPQTYEIHALRVEYGPHLTLSLGAGASNFPGVWEAGTIGYVPVLAHVRPDAPDATLAASLRLVDGTGHRVSQRDAPLPIAGRDVPSLSLPVPAGTPPGEYTLELVVYDAASLEPVAPVDISVQPHASGLVEIADAALSLRTLEITASARAFSPAETLTRFDYIHLLAADFPASVHPIQSSWPIQFAWWPAASPYTDTYSFTVRWLAESGTVVTQWTEPLGPPWYPSGIWHTARPVLDHKELSLPSDSRLEPGTYTVQLGLARATDGLKIPARARWSVGAHDWFTLGTITVEP